jgi:hypothetical protein
VKGRESSRAKLDATSCLCKGRGFSRARKTDQADGAFAPEERFPAQSISKENLFITLKPKPFLISS